MSTKFNKLRNDLNNLENDVEDSVSGSSQSSSNRYPRVANYLLLFAFVATLLFYTGNRFSEFFSGIDVNSIEQAVQSLTEYDEDLLNGMGEWMEDMGYGSLSHEELTELRREGVTATETQRFHDAGYTNVTLEQLVELQDADVSATYASMMKELGYDLSIDELIETRRNGVTAHFTSRMMDLGYTRDQLTKDNLMRMRKIGVSDNLAERLMEERGDLLSIDELIRYRISNQ